MKTANEYLPTSYWIMKSEPSIFSFENLIQKKFEFWDGVRNYQARNFMMHDMHVSHKVLFYHSNADPSGIAGSCEVIENAKPDDSARHPNSPYYDKKSTKENPIWYGLTVGKPIRFKKFVSLFDMKNNPLLKDILLLRKGQRLSILPLNQSEFEIIFKMGQ